jgi:hypothetical protein
MEQKKKNLLEMHKLGFTNKTLSLMTESQIAMILEKIKKKESKEATMTYRPDEKIPAKNIDPTKMKKNADGSVSMETTEATMTYRPDEKIPAKNIDPTKMKKNADGSVSTEVAEGKKKKKYNPFAVCTASVGRKNKKKYEDCVMGVKKKLKEGRNPYEYLIESKMEEIVENNLSPKMTKGEIMSIIAEKKMMKKRPISRGTVLGGEMEEGDTKTAPSPSRTTEKEPAKRKPNPGKNPGVSPAPKASYMEGDTKTAPTRTTPKTEPARRTANPGKKTGPQENPKPKAGKADSDMESKKSEIITAIFNLIDKELK